jgi:putative spermidine/putrescine transport system permease protein
MALPPHITPIRRVGLYAFRASCGLVFLFLAMPLLIIIPLSFNAEPYFVFTKEMLSLAPEGYSLRWYDNFLYNPDWTHAIGNSFIIASATTMLATVLGTLAALGLSRSSMSFRAPIMAVLISPMIVPVIISGAGAFFFYSYIGLTHTLLGIILAHTALGTPFVVITVTATLVGFDHTLARASASLGATPYRTVMKVVVPLILPGVISGALFAFVTSFDEVVVVLFLADYDQRTIPLQMWSGIREQLSPTILAVATMLIAASVIMMAVIELLRRRNERLRGVTPN